MMSGIFFYVSECAWRCNVSGMALYTRECFLFHHLQPCRERHREEYLKYYAVRIKVHQHKHLVITFPTPLRIWDGDPFATVIYPTPWHFHCMLYCLFATTAVLFCSELWCWDRMFWDQKGFWYKSILWGKVATLKFQFIRQDQPSWECRKGSISHGAWAVVEDIKNAGEDCHG